MERDKDVPPPLNYSVGDLGVLSPSAKSFTLFRGTVLGSAVLEVRPDMIQVYIYHLVAICIFMPRLAFL